MRLDSVHHTFTDDDRPLLVMYDYRVGYRAPCLYTAREPEREPECEITEATLYGQPYRLTENERERIEAELLSATYR